ncbi:MAG: hypothetical protein PHW62_00670 [Candidatus Ratteibacteria bacterium]|nr:hypothetical protein [Candidatus Ratteibacteria bacterium]
MTEERTKTIGKYLILFMGFIKGTRQTQFYEVSVHLKNNYTQVERGNYTDKEMALNAYRRMKRVSDVHKFLNALNPTDRPLRNNDARMLYNR